MNNLTALERLALEFGTTPARAALLICVVCLVVIVIWVGACWALSRAVVYDEGDPRPPLPMPPHRGDDHPRRAA